MKKNFGLLINGKWLKNRETIDVFNPFDGKKSLQYRALTQIKLIIQ